MSPYRTSADMTDEPEAAPPHTHKFGGGWVMKKCVPPGDFMCWWSNVNTGSTWKCGECGKIWRRSVLSWGEV